MNERALALKQCLDACQEIEEIASKIYYFNADLFAHNDKISRLWRKTAIEEENHALQIMLAKRIVTTVSGTPVEICRSDSTRNLIRALYEAIKRTAPPPLDEAIRNAIFFEETLARFHRDNANFFREKELAGLFKALMMHDREHVEDLECALNIYSQSEI